MNYLRSKLYALGGIMSLILAISCGGDDSPKPNLDTPKISVNVTNLDFGNLDLNQESSVLSASVTAKFLEGDVTVSVEDGFEISQSETSGFGVEDLTISKANLADDATVAIYVKAKASSTEGSITGKVKLASKNANDVSIPLTVLVGLEINGTLFMSEYLEQYSSSWTVTLPLDSGILGWNLNTDTVMNKANSGGGYPASTVPNNQVYNVWYAPVPLNGASLRGSMGLSDNSSLAITGYPKITGARNIVMASSDPSELFNWLNKNNGQCKSALTSTGNNTSIGRRFQKNGYRGGDAGEVYMSALVNVSELGGKLSDASSDLKGSGDLIALANATSGASNNNTIKVLARSDDAGGLKFGLLKENEGNPEILGEKKFKLNTTYLIVLKHKFVDGDQNDISELYVFAEGDKIPISLSDESPVAKLDETYSDGGVKSGADPLDLNIVYIRERNQSVKAPHAEITGIRVGDTWRATIFADHGSATNSNDITLNSRVLTNKGSDCTP